VHRSRSRLAGPGRPSLLLCIRPGIPPSAVSPMQCADTGTLAIMSRIADGRTLASTKQAALRQSGRALASASTASATGLPRAEARRGDGLGRRPCLFRWGTMTLADVVENA
jgi:hypothetical protein